VLNRQISVQIDMQDILELITLIGGSVMMKFDMKVIFLGGLVFYVAMFALSMITGPFIHQGVLEPYYMAHQEFWRPELNQEPPDIASLMPRWITVGLITTFIFAGIYDNIRSAFDGSGVMKGLKFGVVMGLIYASIGAGWSGFFNLPNAIWMWWAIEGFIMYIAGGAALGWFVGKFASD